MSSRTTHSIIRGSHASRQQEISDGWFGFGSTIEANPEWLMIRSQTFHNQEAMPHRPGSLTIAFRAYDLGELNRGRTRKMYSKF